MRTQERLKHNAIIKNMQQLRRIITKRVGHIYANEIQNPYDSFTRKDLHFET